jgi:N-formylglutamate amidohydrolase
VSPIILHVPHSGLWIPPAERSRLLLDETELALELGRMTDWYTDQLAVNALEQAHVPGTVFANRASRLLVDPERFTDTSEPMAAVGLGAVYLVTSQLRTLRHPDPADDARLLTQWFHPYAAAFAALVDETLARHGKTVIIDLHSYPSVPLPYEPDPTARRPAVCVGTDTYHTPPPLSAAVFQAFANMAGGVAENTPFAGTYVPLPHLRRTRKVTSVMVEIRRDLYQEEPCGPLHAGYDTLVRHLADLLTAVAEAS